jgi:hypothetical protein
MKLLTACGFGLNIAVFIAVFGLCLGIVLVLAEWAVFAVNGVSLDDAASGS